jgi:hypothetical protein
MGETEQAEAPGKGSEPLAQGPAWGGKDEGGEQGHVVV